METEEDNTTERHSSRKPWPIIVVVLALTAIAIWLVPGEEEAKIADIPLPTGQETIPLTDQPSLPQTAATGATATKSIEDGSAARSLIAQAKQNNTLPADLLLNAHEFQREGKITDAYLLYFYAARQGDAGASLVLGKLADPAYFSAGTSPLENADAEQAHKWYSVSATAGNAKAAALLAELRQQVEADAADGDLQAQRLALQWKD